MSTILRILAFINCALLSLVFEDGIFLRPGFKSLFGYSLLFIAISLFGLLIVQYRRKAGLPESMLIVDGTLGIACLFFDFVLMGFMGD